MGIYDLFFPGTSVHFSKQLRGRNGFSEEGIQWNQILEKRRESLNQDWAVVYMCRRVQRDR